MIFSYPTVQVNTLERLLLAVAIEQDAVSCFYKFPHQRRILFKLPLKKSHPLQYQQSFYRAVDFSCKYH